MSGERAALEFVATSKWYGQVSALTDVSVRFEPGVTGLVGQNGAGKSTMMKLASGLLRPSFGDVLLMGQSPTIPRVRAQLGYVADVDRYYEHQSGLVFVTWMLRISGMGGREAKRRAVELLEELGLSDAMRRPISGYSKGMRQRVKIAVALGHRPKVLLLDEPMTGLDPVARQEMAALMRRLGSEGVVVVVSSHVLHELQSVADQIVVVNQGRMLAEGNIAEIRDKLDDQPRRILLVTDTPRALVPRLMGSEEVVKVEIVRNGVEISTESSVGVDSFLTAIGAEGLIDELLPLDDSLESVFGYLVK